MRATLIITRYPAWAIPFAIIAMALFRLPLMLSKKSIGFWQLMGSGKNGTFDIVPDLRQWALLLVHKNDVAALSNNPVTNAPFINWYFRFFKTACTCFLLEAIEGHGLWNGVEAFGKLPKQTNYEGEIAVLTRATIRLGQLKNFWKNVPPVSKQMLYADGLIASYGIGEVPFVKQATFSIWKSKAAMKAFAYGMAEHQQVIRKTHSQKWYSEEMFVRFKIISKLTIQH